MLDKSGAQPGLYTATSTGWHHSVSDLSSYAGQVYSTVWAGIAGEPWTGYGTWDIWIANAAIVRADGTVLPMFNGQSTSVPGIGSTCGGNGQTFQTELTPTSDPAVNTNYYVDDHLGTTQIELAAGGWPVWKGEFTPFGQEVGITQNDLGSQPADGTSMRYKFTGKERDQESGLDYFGARYYASNMGRWISPDWASKPEAVPYSQLNNPQSLNLYGYVLNNPLSQADPDGHVAPRVTCTGGAAACTQAAERALRVSAAVSAGVTAAVVGGAEIEAVAVGVRGSIGFISRTAISAYLGLPVLGTEAAQNLMSARDTVSNSLNAIKDAAASGEINLQGNTAGLLKGSISAVARNFSDSDINGAVKQAYTGIEAGGDHIDELGQVANRLSSLARNLNGRLGRSNISDQTRALFTKAVGAIQQANQNIQKLQK